MQLDEMCAMVAIYLVNIPFSTMNAYRYPLQDLSHYLTTHDDYFYSVKNLDFHYESMFWEEIVSKCVYLKSSNEKS